MWGVGKERGVEAVSNESKATERAPERYEEVVKRLEEVVKRLEGGELSLEDSLKAFEEGIGLVRKGEELLTKAESRIEQLLNEDGESKVVPLDLRTSGGGQSGKSEPQRTSAPAEAADDDIPF